VLTFDVEEHNRIEAAVGLVVSEGLKADYRQRLDSTTRWILDCLAERSILATFYVVGEIARHNPALVRAMSEAGHEVASHSQEHRRLHRLNSASFRADLRRSKETLEQVTGKPVVGFRAPTFSVTRETAWAVDVLAEERFLYDSSVYPVWHDRYGVPDAPRTPFWLAGRSHSILELPPATLRVGGSQLAVGGGGYFRLFPLFLMQKGIGQLTRGSHAAPAVLYFHPWEFDPDQPRLPLSAVGRFRTYVGLSRTQGRLLTLLDQHHFSRAVDVASDLLASPSHLPRYDLTARTQAEFSMPVPTQAARVTSDGLTEG
jgi:polysaccharide deacetylase family protein (PEP-CTERM system associated)